MNERSFNEGGKRKPSGGRGRKPAGGPTSRGTPRGRASRREPARPPLAFLDDLGLSPESVDEGAGGKTSKPAAFRVPGTWRDPRPSEGRNLAHRERILKAAEQLFSARGYHATSLREVAEAADVSLGNIYNHFATKEDLFAALMGELEKIYLDPGQPIPRALEVLKRDPAALEEIGFAARETVHRFASYIRLIYVDVLEFRGAHLGRLYGRMRERFDEILGKDLERFRREGSFSDVDPIVAIMLATISYMYYFTVDHVFGVPQIFGLDDDRLVREFARVFRLGILRRR